MEDAPGYQLPMFPLGQVLFPGMVLPLHIFETRYRALLEHLVEMTDSDPHPAEFGVNLITRGSEVGGGDLRADVGTVARLVQAQRFDDGRWAAVAVGVRRCRVRQWLPEAPWPAALVTDEIDRADEVDEALLERVVTELRTVLAIAAELGDEGAPATTAIAEDPTLVSYQVATLAPFGPLDRQHLLEVAGPADRLRLAEQLLAEHHELLTLRLRAQSHGDETPDQP